MIRDSHHVTPWYGREPEGESKLAPQCCLCTFRHLDGEPCLEVRQVPPGAEGIEAKWAEQTVSALKRNAARLREKRRKTPTRVVESSYRRELNGKVRKAHTDEAAPDA